MRPWVIERGKKWHKQGMQRPNTHLFTHMLAPGGGADSHELDHSHAPDLNPDFTGETTEVAEVVFKRNLQLMEEYEKSVERNPTRQRLGHKIMTGDDQEKLELHAEEKEQSQQKVARRRDRVQPDHSIEAERVVAVRGNPLGTDHLYPILVCFGGELPP